MYNVLEEKWKEGHKEEGLYFRELGHPTSNKTQRTKTHVKKWMDKAKRVVLEAESSAPPTMTGKTTHQRLEQLEASVQLLTKKVTTLKTKTSSL